MKCATVTVNLGGEGRGFERAIGGEVSLLLGRANTNTNTIVDTNTNTVRNVDTSTDTDTNSYSRNQFLFNLGRK